MFQIISTHWWRDCATKTESEYDLRFDAYEEYVRELIDRIVGMSLRGVKLCNRWTEKHPGKCLRGFCKKANHFRFGSGHCRAAQHLIRREGLVRGRARGSVLQGKPNWNKLSFRYDPSRGCRVKGDPHDGGARQREADGGGSTLAARRLPRSRMPSIASTGRHQRRNSSLLCSAKRAG